VGGPRLLALLLPRHRHPHRTVSKRIAANREHVPPEVFSRAWQAQLRLHHRHRTLVSHGKRSTVANVAVARELCGFVWAAMTKQPLREEAAAA
jgi:transposase